MPRRVLSKAQFQPASDQSLLVSFGQQIAPAANEQVRKLVRLLELEPIAAVRNLHPAHRSLLLKFDPLRISHEELQALLGDYFDRLEKLDLPAPRTVEIPVCYGDDFGPDLADLCKLHSFSAQEAIQLHSSPSYTVYFLGFVPGFAYLGELPSRLVTPRLASPRKIVPAGSVGIAGSQTGVYPFATPGGWRLIGRTPLEMFRPDREHLSLLAIGDRVRFVPITSERFAELQRP